MIATFKNRTYEVVEELPVPTLLRESNGLIRNTLSREPARRFYSKRTRTRPANRAERPERVAIHPDDAEFERTTEIRTEPNRETIEMTGTERGTLLEQISGALNVRPLRRGGEFAARSPPGSQPSTAEPLPRPAS